MAFILKDELFFQMFSLQNILVVWDWQTTAHRRKNRAIPINIQERNVWVIGLSSLVMDVSWSCFCRLIIQTKTRV